jgi:stress response protein SCP2
MSVNNEEIVWDIDWDELDLLPQAEQSADLATNTGAAAPAPTPAFEPPPVHQEGAIAPEPRRDEPLPKAPSAQPPTLPSTPVSTPTPTAAVPSNRPQPSQQPAKKLIRGERFDLGPIFAQKPQISIELISSNPAAVKLICLGLDAAEIVAGTAYCVGPRQPASPCGGITHAARTDGGQEILVRASILPAGIKRLEVSVVTSDSTANLGNTVEGIRLWAGGIAVAESSNLDPVCASSSCATLVEIYERQGTWRMRVIGEVLARSVNELLAKHGAKTS